jgi:hypothetical protein
VLSLDYSFLELCIINRIKILKIENSILELEKETKEGDINRE